MSDGAWRQITKLLPLEEQPEGGLDASNFGTSVAVEGDTIVVGAYFSDEAAVFERRNGVWTRASTLGAGSQYVDIHSGSIIASNNNGANIYHRGPSGWAQVQILTNGYSQPDADYGGPAVAISATTAVHGSYGVDDYWGDPQGENSWRSNERNQALSGIRTLHPAPRRHPASRARASSR
jgi:hypothetical protein